MNKTSKLYQNQGWMVDNWYWTNNSHNPTNEGIIKKTHQETHMGADAVVANIRRYGMGPKMQSNVDAIVRKCQSHCANNPKVERKPPMGEVKRRIAPGENWQIDFSHNINIYLF